jgi:hypothetical protein
LVRFQNLTHEDQITVLQTRRNRSAGSSVASSILNTVH